MHGRDLKKIYTAGPGQSSFGPAFLFLNGPQRRALCAFYAYARSVDDIADDPALNKETKLAGLSAWKAEIESLFSGGGETAMRCPLSSWERVQSPSLWEHPPKLGGALIVPHAVQRERDAISPCDYPR